MLALLKNVLRTATADRQSVIGRVGPAVLFSIGIMQVALAYGGGLLNPAKGGGFGLFSTVDSIQSRVVHVHLFGPGGSMLQVLNPNVLHSAPGFDSAVSYPHRRAMKELAATFASGLYGMTVEKARVIVWKVSMDSQTHRVERIWLAEAEAKRLPGAAGFVPTTATRE